jgi:hypothetical protein
MFSRTQQNRTHLLSIKGDSGMTVNWTIELVFFRRSKQVSTVTLNEVPECTTLSSLLS